MNKNIRNTYDDWKRPTQLKQISAISFLTAILYMLFALFDYFISPKHLLPIIFLIHLIIMPSVLLTLSIFAFLKKTHTTVLVLLFFAPIIATIGNVFIVTNLQNLPIYSSEIYAIIFWTFTIPGLRILYTLGSALIVVTISIISAYFFHKFQFNILALHTFLLIVSLSLGLLARYLYEDANKTSYNKQVELSQELNNKNLLIKEVFHRVKNNLQIIYSLLSLQSKRIKDDSAKLIFEENTQRIKSMAMMHEMLYQYENLEVIHFKDYINNLTDTIKQSLKDDTIKFNIDCEDITLCLKNAVPFGLIINELFINSIKYAFDEKEQDKKISVHMYLGEEDKFILKVSDNGKGIDFKNLKHGFGSKLIDMLAVYQLKGSVESFNENGLCYILKFNKTIFS